MKTQNLNTKASRLMAAAIGVLLCSAPGAFSQSTTFTYQGRLSDGANPTSGIYDLQFTIYDAVSGGDGLLGH